LEKEISTAGWSADMVFALRLAQKVHAGQMRVSGVSYMTHPLAVMYLTETLLPPHFKLKTEALCVALLHDTLEDAKTHSMRCEAHRQIHYNFPDCVTAAVEVLTKKPEHKLAYLQYILQIRENPIARIVKQADIQHNLVDVDDYKPKNKDKYQMALWILQH